MVPILPLSLEQLKTCLVVAVSLDATQIPTCLLRLPKAPTESPGPPQSLLMPRAEEEEVTFPALVRSLGYHAQLALSVPPDRKLLILVNAGRFRSELRELISMQRRAGSFQIVKLSQDLAQIGTDQRHVVRVIIVTGLVGLTRFTEGRVMLVSHLFVYMFVCLFF